MTLYHLAQQIQASPIGQTIREFTWLFPAIEVTHLLALATLGGSVLMVAFGVFGVGLTTPPKVVEVSTRPYTLAALATMIVTGTLLGISETLKLLDREAFLVKMIALAAALLFSFLVFFPLVRRGSMGLGARAAAGVTLALWLTVAMAGRWIGFS